MIDRFALSMLIHSLRHLAANGDIKNLRSVDFRPSEYFLFDITLQRPFPQGQVTEANPWLRVRGRKCPRLTLAVSFSHAGQTFLALDVERRNISEKFCFLLAKVPANLAASPPGLRKFTSKLADEVHAAKGVLKNVGLNTYLDHHRVLHHYADEFDDVVGVRKTYLLEALESLANLQ